MLINLAELKVKLVTKFKAKKWISYGDSITASNGWQPAVAAKLSLIHTRRGIGGTTIAERGSIAWVDAEGNYIARPPATQPAGTTEILSSMCNSQRINAMIPLDTEVLTIMGGTNDYGTHIPLGTVLPTNETPILDESTFIGAFCSMIEKIQTRVPHCRIIIMTPIPRYHNGRYESRNRAGLLTSDYAKAAKDVAAFYGLPCIDLHSKVGWNKINGGSYLKDGIHPNTKRGYSRMSEVVSGELKALEIIS
jgi:lysophospholipase L1-like esterase